MKRRRVSTGRIQIRLRLESCSQRVKGFARLGGYHLNHKIFFLPFLRYFCRFFLKYLIQSKKTLAETYGISWACGKRYEASFNLYFLLKQNFWQSLGLNEVYITPYQNTGGSIGHWTIHNIRVSRNPPYICCTPKDVICMVVKSISKEKKRIK